MRNAELKGWHWLDRSHSRSDLSITIPHSTLRIPHSALLAQLESHLTWRMFAFWAPTAIAVIATGAGVISLLLRH